MSARAVYVLRSALFGVAAVVSALTIATTDGNLTSNEAFQSGLAGITAALAYAGIGGVSKSIEPAIGRKPEAAGGASRRSQP